MDIKINMDIKMPKIEDLCPYCFGTGKQKAMQAAINNQGETVRVSDKIVKCLHCKGKGFVN